MWTDVLTATTFHLLWLIVIVVLYLNHHRFIPQLSGAKAAVTRLLVIAILARIVPALLLPVGATYDIESYGLVRDALTQGNDVYSVVSGRYPYFPFYMYLLALSGRMATWSGIPFVVWVKLWPVMADVILVWIIFKATNRQTSDNLVAFRYGLSYALHPLAILVSAYHGQFDALPTLFMLAAWYLLILERRLSSSAIMMGMAIVTKTWPVIMLPVVLLRRQRWRDRIVYAMTALLVPVLFVLIYQLLYDGDLSRMMRRSLTHSGVAGYWGFSGLMAVANLFDTRWQPLYDFVIGWGRFPIVLFGGVSLLLTALDDVVHAIVTILLTIFAATSGMAFQWLVWVIPFAILVGERRWLTWYTLAGLVYSVVHLYGIHMYHWIDILIADDLFAQLVLRLSPQLSWLVIVSWVIDRYRRLIREWPGGRTYWLELRSKFREW